MSNLEWCLCLALDLFHSHTISNLNQCKASCEVDIKDTLPIISVTLKQTKSWLTNSVMIIETQAFPVNGKAHCLTIFALPFLSVCSIVTTTLVFSGLLTRSIAPPNPFIFPGNI